MSEDPKSTDWRFDDARFEDFVPDDRVAGASSQTAPLWWAYIERDDLPEREALPPAPTADLSWLESDQGLSPLESVGGAGLTAAAIIAVVIIVSVLVFAAGAILLSPRPLALSLGILLLPALLVSLAYWVIRHRD